MSVRGSDGKNFRRIPRTSGDRIPAVGIRRPRVVYTAVGGETSIDLNTLTPRISYQPGQAQLELKSSLGSMISGVDFFENSGTSIGFPTPGLTAGEIIEITQTLEYSGNLVAQVRPDEYSAIATAGQTIIDADFSWPLNQNPGKRHGAIQVFINGILQQRGSTQDYVETQIGTSTNTNRITLNSALIGGENISIIRLYQAIDETAASTQFNNTRLTDIQETFRTGFEPYVDESVNMINVPSTQIVNRARIPDLTQDLKVRLGIERVMTQFAYQLQNEFGPNGETVWGIQNDSRGLVRLVGSGFVNYNDSYGQKPWSTTTNDYIEIVFYGTGLNLLTSLDSNSARDWRVSVDGGTEGSNIYLTYSNVLTATNNNVNQIINVANGLTPGIHTVKIRQNNANGIGLSGYEVINASSTFSSNLVVNPGVAYSSGRKLSLLSQSTSLLSKPASLTGTKGGRVVAYLDVDGTVKQAVNATNASQLTLSSADHTNEEAVRVYNFREFGSGRADDFSIGTTATNYSYTLDDGTTTLVGSDTGATVFQGVDGITFANSNSYIVIMFVGTGIDVHFATDTGTSGQPIIFIDGTVSLNLPLIAQNGVRSYKIASGLPYGTHTIYIRRSTATNFTVPRFTVYQPKKPSIPTGSIELADYNVMANYSNGIVSGQILALSSGILHKQSTREATYVGAWSAFYASPNVVGAQYTSSSTIGNYVEYTFYGTGVNIIASGGTTTIQLDGSNYTGSATAVGTGSSWTAGTSTWVGASTNGAGLIISGLNLKLWRIRITLSAATTFFFHAIHVITPIHAVASTTPSEVQNALPVGSCSLSDSRAVSPIKSEKQKKNSAQAVGVTSSPTTSANTPVPLRDMSCTIRTSGGDLRAIFQVRASNNLVGNAIVVVIFVNGASVGVQSVNYSDTGNQTYDHPISGVVRVSVPAGVHKVDLYWYAAAGQARATGTDRILLVEEV